MPYADLHEQRNRYDASARRIKQAALQRFLTSTAQLSARALAKLHHDALFLAAFPDDPEIHKLAIRALAACAQKIRRLPREERSKLNDTGICSTSSSHTFPFAIARWLTENFRDEVEIDWDAVEDAEQLDALVRSVLSPLEVDFFDSDRCNTRDFLRLATSAQGSTALAWLIGRASDSRSRTRTFVALYDKSPLPIRWSLGDSRGSITMASVPRRIVSRRSMRRGPADPVAQIASPFQGIRLLPAAEARRVISLARASLTSRCREVDPITYANPDEVWLAPLGKGAELAIFGATPGYRMTLEANYGYLLLSNGIPIGYGGVTPLYWQANTGINIFDPFRGSEAAFLWGEMLRAFATLFHVRRFVVNGYQFGNGNAEAIASGAFWFYYRMGFRPPDAPRAKLAEREAERIAAGGYRTPASVLRTLARGDLYLTLPGFDEDHALDESLPAQIAEVVAHSTLAGDLSTSSGLARRASNEAQRQAAARLAPLITLLNGTDEAEILKRVLRAKAAPQERDFVIAAQRAPELWRALKRAVTPKG